MATTEDDRNVPSELVYIGQFLNWAFGFNDRLMFAYYLTFGFAIFATSWTGYILIAQVLTGVVLGLIIGRATAIDSTN